MGVENHMMKRKLAQKLISQGFGCCVSVDVRYRGRERVCGAGFDAVLHRRRREPEESDVRDEEFEI